MSPAIFERYNYSFPKELIAQAPASPRDSAKLLIYNRKTDEVFLDTFLDLAKYLPPRSVLVFNETKVIPARFTVTKLRIQNQGINKGGGSVTLLYLTKVADQKIKALSDRKLLVGSILKGAGGLSLTVESKKEGEYMVRVSVGNFETWLAKYGVAPLPPYIKHSPLSRAQAKREYQTIFAKIAGSVAAPTASLHFTKRLMQKLRRAGHDLEFVTLHVGLGTFAKVTDENLKQGKLHQEHYELSGSTAQRLKRAKKEGRPIIAVGTTVVRTLESFAKTGRHAGSTELFIQEGYDFKITEGLITNFHVPKSSLLMLVSALVGREKIFEMYQEAIRRKFKLFSFGDGMLIL